MIRLVTILVLLLFSPASLKAQYDGEGSDEISRFHAGSMWFFSGIRPAKPEKVRKYDRLLIDLTYNDWSGDRKPFTNNWSSIGVNANFMFDIPLNKGNNVSIGTGLTYSFIRIHHYDYFLIDSTNSYTEYKLQYSIDPVERRLLCFNTISLPIELRFRTKGWKHLKFHMGGKIGYGINVYSKTVNESSNGRTVIKQFNYPDYNRLIYSVHARFGIRNWALYGSYNLNPIFGHSKSTKLNILQFGVSLSLF